MNNQLQTIKTILFQKKMLILLALILGIAAVTVLTLHKQIFVSRASQEVINAVDIKDANGNPLSCSSEECETSTMDVKIKLKDLAPLLNLKQ